MSQRHQTRSFNKPELGWIQKILPILHSARNGFPNRNIQEGIVNIHAERPSASIPTPVSRWPWKFPGLKTQPSAAVSPQRASAGLRKRQLIQGTMVHVTIILLTQRRLNKNQSLQQPVRWWEKPMSPYVNSLHGQFTKDFKVELSKFKVRSSFIQGTKELLELIPLNNCSSTSYFTSTEIALEIKNSLEREQQTLLRDAKNTL